MKAPGKYAVFLDIDNTVLSLNSGSVFIKEAFRKGMMRKRDLLRAMYYGWLHKLDLRETTRILADMIAWMKGRIPGEIGRFAENIVNNHLISAIRPGIAREILFHREKEAELVILSSAISEICLPLGFHLGMGRNNVLCTTLETQNGLFTGTVSGRFCIDDEKKSRLLTYCSANNYSPEQAYYYGDSISDLPALEVVGNPVCVAPDRKLRKIAETRNWRIMAQD